MDASSLDLIRPSTANICDDVVRLLCIPRQRTSFLFAQARRMGVRVLVYLDERQTIMHCEETAVELDVTRWPDLVVEYVGDRPTGRSWANCDSTPSLEYPRPYVIDDDGKIVCETLWSLDDNGHHLLRSLSYWRCEDAAEDCLERLTWAAATRNVLRSLPYLPVDLWNIVARQSDEATPMGSLRPWKLTGHSDLPPHPFGGPAIEPLD